MDSLRKQLDALMGANRNGDVTEVKRKYYDRDVCRLFLAGLCPHDLFQLTKMDLGACSKIHSLQLRKEYEDAKAKGKDNYDREMEDVLERHIGECERKITRAIRRLEDDDAKAATAISVSEVTKSTEVEDFTKQIKQKLKEAEYLDLEGRSDDKIRIMEVVEELRAKRADKQLGAREVHADNSKTPAVDVRITDQKLRVCDICGAFLSIYDSDRRLADHFGGKLHLGYMQIRQKLDDLQEERNKARKLLDDERLWDRASSRDRERDLVRERDKGHNRRSRERDHDRSRRSRERDCDHRSRERDHDRKREHSGDYSSRKRSRSRSRELSRDRSDHYRWHDKYGRY
ncbi:uncharacterized protein LOC131039063 isoform X2 [Cryptomeria japonica]|uniref:uncharacterized protein LOC131039063 isoform X2 n=1 Tax=Cryptomeria japonica TaxID=3369 RepID=UPI0025AD2682|nr:uncharacterized protein LOC131039063 isoform X2 [Cryptomeria japonica]